MAQPDGERLATLETEVKNTNGKIEDLGKLVMSLHGKFDALIKMITENYVAKDTFEEYRKNKWMERIITVLITGIIMGMIGFVFRELGI